MKRTLTALVLVFVFLGSLGLMGCGLEVPRPEIKTGEFHFSVTYEYGGEIKTVSGVYVCEYDGIDWAIDMGYHRTWRGYIKDGTTDEVIHLGIAEDGGEVDLFLHFDPDRFMGDYFRKDDEPFAPMMSVKLSNEEGMWFENEADYIAEIYGARVISYEYDEPIENSFGIFK